MAEPRAYFTRDDDGRLLPSRLCTGAWNTRELHIAPVNGVLMHELERWLDEREAAQDGKLIARVSLDYMGVLDFNPCDVTCSVVRPGRAVELVEAVLSQNGRPALRARVWRLAAGDTHDVAAGAAAPLHPGPQDAPAFDMTDEWPGEYIETLDVRSAGDSLPGRNTVWIRTPWQVVEAEPSSELTRFVLLVDTANGVAVRRSPDEWQFPNLDLTIHLFRQPAGAWVGLDTSVSFGPTGQGLTTSDLHDERGHVGRAEQALIVRPR